MSTIEPLVPVWDVERERALMVPVPVAAAGVIAFGRAHFGPGTPAAAVAEARAARLLEDHGWEPVAWPAEKTA
jgi:hypothetical protein